MAHANITLDIQGRRTGEPEGLHVGEDLRLEQTAFRPGTSKPADQFLVDRTPVLIDQLNSLIAAIVRVAVIHDNVKTVCKNQSIANIFIFC